MRARIETINLLLSCSSRARFVSNMAALQSSRFISQTPRVSSSAYIYANDVKLSRHGRTGAMSSSFFSDELSHALRRCSSNSVPTSTVGQRYISQFRALLPSPSTSNLLSPSSTPLPSPLSPLDRIRSQQVLEHDSDYLLPSQLSTLDMNVEPESVNSAFEALGLTSELLAAVNELGLREPTEIQALGIPAALRGESLVMASHTGSGKTLAYLLPLVQVSLLASNTQLTCPWHVHCDAPYARNANTVRELNVSDLKCGKLSPACQDIGCL